MESEPPMEHLIESSMENHIGSGNRQHEHMTGNIARFGGEKSCQRESSLSHCQPYQRKSMLELTTDHRNGFSKSMGDLSLLNQSSKVYKRRSVIFEEDISAHAAILERARSRFRELEEKYPDVFKNTCSPRARSVNSLAFSGKSASVHAIDRVGIGYGNKMLSSNVSNVRHNRSRAELVDEVKETDQLGDISLVNQSCFTQRTRVKPPPLSTAMRSHHLEDSCDSAFDEIDRDSVNSRVEVSPDRSPISNCSKTANSRFLYPGDSLESDKDSGISTDRPFVPKTQILKSHRPISWPEPEVHVGVSKARSLSNLQINNGERATKQFNIRVTPAAHRGPVERRGILKSAAYRNQGIKTGSLDLPSQPDQLVNSNRAALHGNENKKPGSNVYHRMSRYLASGVSQDEAGDSDAETVYSIQSEVLVRPRLSARQQYLSTYSLNRTSFDSSYETRLHKARSLPNLDNAGSSFDHMTGLGGEYNIRNINPKKKRKRILQRFGRRSGLYVVNDIPESEKPRLPDTKGSRRSKKLKHKKSTEKVTHINESTKDWFDHTTAVSRPTGGQSLGRIVTLREDIGLAYEIELRKPDNGLFGFFIQKGYKQFRKGIFISRIMDSSCAKFLAGLLNSGDELLEINGESTKAKTTSEVHTIMANSDRLLLTVLPYVGRKDW